MLLKAHTDSVQSMILPGEIRRIYISNLNVGLVYNICPDIISNRAFKYPSYEIGFRFVRWCLSNMKGFVKLSLCTRFATVFSSEK